MAFTKPKAAQIDFDVTNISDPLITLNYGQTGTPDDDVGIVVERGSGTNVALIWDESADTFAVINTTETGSTAGNVTISSYADLKVGSFTVDSLNFNDNNIITNVSNADIVLDPSGTGKVWIRSNLTTTGTLIAKSLTYPTSDGTSGQVIKTDGAGTLSFTTISSTPGGSTTQVQYNSSGSFAGSANLTFDGTTLTATALTIDTNTLYVDATNNAVGVGTTSPNTYGKLTVSGGDIAILAQNDVRFYDTDNSNYVSLRSAGTVAANITWTLPSTDGTNTQVLQTDGSGGLSWANSGGSSAAGYFSSSITDAPGKDGNYDLAEGTAQDGTEETPFETSNDAFNISVAPIFDCMDPVGSIVTVDYGSVA